MTSNFQILTRDVAFTEFDMAEQVLVSCVCGSLTVWIGISFNSLTELSLIQAAVQKGQVRNPLAKTGGPRTSGCPGRWALLPLSVGAVRIAELIAIWWAIAVHILDNIPVNREMKGMYKRFMTSFLIKTALVCSFQLFAP